MVGALCSGGRGKGGRELGRLLPQRGKRNRWLPPTTTRNCFTGHLRGAERGGGIAATSSVTVSKQPVENGRTRVLAQNWTMPRVSLRLQITPCLTDQ